MNKKIKGIIPPMVTPLLDRDTLDIAGLERLIEHILAGGVHGLFILGTTGEAPSLSYKIRKELIERTLKQVNGRVPVLVGITDTAFIETVNLADYAADHQSAGVVLAPPYYFPAGQPELIEYIQNLCERLPLPLYLYNMPGCTKINIAVETVIELSKLDKVAGLKDSSADMIYFNKIRTLIKDEDFSLLVGPEELLAQSVLFGSDGGVCGGANMFPKLYVDLYNAAASGDIEKTLQLHSKVLSISTSIYSIGKYGSGFLKGVKCALNLMGICSDFLAEPFHRFRENERQKVSNAIKELNL